MKPVKSVVLLAAGALVLSACDMNKKNNKTTSVEPTTTTPAANQSSAIGEEAPAVEAGAAAASVKTSEGSGAISPEAVTEENLNAPQGYTDEDISDEVEEQEAIPDTTSEGTGAGDDYEYVDETSSEPDDVRGGRDARMVPRNNEIDNTSSEPDLDR